MTTDAAYQKLSYAVGKADSERLRDSDRISRIKEILYTNFAHELEPDFCMQALKMYAK